MKKLTRLLEALLENDTRGYYSRVRITKPKSLLHKEVEGEITGPNELYHYFSDEFSYLIKNGITIDIERGRKKIPITNPNFVNELKITESNNKRLFLFTPERIIFSLERLKHYTSTDVQDFQRYILLTNYEFYMDSFRKKFKNDDLVESERKNCQMPTIHLRRENNEGISIVNIGVSPANAKTITDHLAVLRPKCFFLLGHAGGLRNKQNK